MPVKVRYGNQNDPTQDCTIRPTPFVQISESLLKNKEGNFGVTYNITFTGTLLPSHGTPYALDPATDQPFEFLPGQVVPDSSAFMRPYDQFDNTPLSQMPKPPRQQFRNKPASSILSKQRALRALFARDGQRIEINDILGDTNATIVCFPRVLSVDFTEGQYVTKAEYTITLEADFLLRADGDIDTEMYVDEEGLIANSGLFNNVGSNVTTLQALLDSNETAFIEDYSEDWSIDVDDTQGETVDNPRSYTISHNLSAVGKTTYGAIDGGQTPYQHKAAWEQAKSFVQRRMGSGGSGIPYPNVLGQLGSGSVDLVASYGGYNHVRSESIDVAGGSYSITESWLLSSGDSLETFNMSISTSNSDPFVNVNIDGNIKGLSKINPEGYGNPELTSASGAYSNALAKYNSVSNSGQFGLTSDIYKRANNSVAVELNSQPVSVSLGTNQYTGEITYALAFNNRPVNIISGVIAESIQVNDTYPGDVFATLPVLGRATGPILQYIGGRTEYKRDVSINLTMDYTKIPYGNRRDTLILKKPSLVEPTAGQIAQLLNELSPKGEPGVRKYFNSAPSESWNPKEGTYSFNISWTYELDK